MKEIRKEIRRWAIIVGTGPRKEPLYARDLFGYRVTSDISQALLQSFDSWGPDRCTGYGIYQNDRVYVPSPAYPTGERTSFIG